LSNHRGDAADELEHGRDLDRIQHVEVYVQPSPVGVSRRVRNRSAPRSGRFRGYFLQKGPVFAALRLHLWLAVLGNKSRAATVCFRSRTAWTLRAALRCLQASR